MQLFAPIFPRESRHISSLVVVKEEKGLVHYFANGMPIYVHGVEEQGAFRHIICLLIEQGLCKRKEVVHCFGITEDFVGKALRIYRAKGGEALYQPQKKQRANKIYGAVLERIQSKLDKGQSVNSIAKEESLREGSIRYQIKIGRLKKTQTLPVHRPQ